MSAARKERMTTGIRFTADLHDRLAAAAGERDISINALVVALCEFGLPRLKPADLVSLFIEEEDENVDRT